DLLRRGAGIGDRHADEGLIDPRQEHQRHADPCDDADDQHAEADHDDRDRPAQREIWEREGQEASAWVAGLSRPPKSSYTAGMMTSVRMVEEASPAMTVMARGRRSSEPSP